MSNLLTLTQDEIDKYNLKGKVPGDTITAEEYSKSQKEYEESRNKDSSTQEEDADNTSAKKKK